MLIQILLIAAIAILAAFVMRRTGADSHLAIRRLALGFFVVAAVLSVLFPGWLSWVANLLGVGRGTDLVLYALIVIFLAFLYTQYRRNMALQRQLTAIARKVAILEALEQERDAKSAPMTQAPEKTDG